MAAPYRQFPRNRGPVLPIPNGRINLVTNPSFEISGGWTTFNNGTGGTVTLPSSDFAYVGSNSAKIVNASAVNNSFLYCDISVVAGQTYSFSVFLKVTAYTSNPAAIRIDSTGFNNLATTNVTAGVQDWTRYSVQYTVPSTGVPSGDSGKLRFILDWTVGTQYWDAALVEASSIVGSYFDGSTFGMNSWLGTANAAISQQLGLYQIYQPPNQPIPGRTKNKLARQQPPSAKLVFPPLKSAAPYTSYWQQPTNEPLRSRVPKRQQPQFKPVFIITATNSQTITGQLRVAENPSTRKWQPTNQPLRSRVPKRLQPIEHSKGSFLVTSSTTQTITGQLRVSENPGLRKWQGLSQPLRNRVPRRQQPRTPFILVGSTATNSQTLTGQIRVSNNPASSLWHQPVNQPRAWRKPKVVVIPGGEVSSVIEAPYLSYWKQPVSEPLRNRIPRRQQPKVSLPYVVITPSQTITGQLRVAENPSTRRWQPVNQPLRNRVPKRQMPVEHAKGSFLVTVANTQTITGQLRVAENPAVRRQQPTNLPLRSRVPRRQQPVRPFIYIATSVTSQTIGGQLRIALNPANADWHQPVNQPRPPRKFKVIEIPGGEVSAVVEAPYLSYWAQPTNQPLRKRVPKRTQPIRPAFILSTGTVQQTIGGQIRIANNPSIFVPRFPISQPLRSRVPKRLQPIEHAKGSFLVTISPSQTIGGQIRIANNPSVNLPRIALSQPLRNRIPRRLQPLPRNIFLVASTPLSTIGGQIRVAASPKTNPMWAQPVNQPLRKRVPKRQMPPSSIYVSRGFNVGTATIGGQIRIYPATNWGAAGGDGGSFGTGTTLGGPVFVDTPFTGSSFGSGATPTNGAGFSDSTPTGTDLWYKRTL